MGHLLDFYLDNAYLKHAINFDVIRFIDEVTNFKPRHGEMNDSIDHLFSSGYCYYFANMLKTAFGGKICWVQDRSHIVWVDCEENCSFEELQSKVAYDISGIYDDYVRLFPIEYLDEAIVEYMHIHKKFHFNHNFYDYCSSYGISEYYAMDFIWGVIPEEIILKDYSDNLTYIQTSYRYWLSHTKEFNQAFEFIKQNSEKNMLLKFHFSKHKGIKESLLIINTL